MKKDEKKTVAQEFYEKHFRVAIFGSARIKPHDALYKNVTDLARAIASEGIDIITGGGPGLMEAANLGQKLSGNTDSHSIGLTIELPFEAQGNRHLDVKQHFEKFSDRLDHFMALSNVVVVMPGGIGTCLELFYSWQLTQVKHICNIPIILHGQMWSELIQWVRQFPLEKSLLSAHDLQNIFCTQKDEEALKIIRDTFQMYQEKGESFCVNSKKYKLTP